MTSKEKTIKKLEYACKNNDLDDVLIISNKLISKFNCEKDKILKIIIIFYPKEFINSNVLIRLSLYHYPFNVYDEILRIVKDTDTIDKYGLIEFIQNNTFKTTFKGIIKCCNFPFKDFKIILDRVRIYTDLNIQQYVYEIFKKSTNLENLKYIVNRYKESVTINNIFCKYCSRKNSNITFNIFKYLFDEVNIYFSKERDKNSNYENFYMLNISIVFRKIFEQWYNMKKCDTRKELQHILKYMLVNCLEPDSLLKIYAECLTVSKYNIKTHEYKIVQYFAYFEDTTYIDFFNTTYNKINFWYTYEDTLFYKCLIRIYKFENYIINIQKYKDVGHDVINSLELVPIELI
jgi:hypothetical protein